MTPRDKGLPMYMTERFGAWQADEASAGGPVTFKLFFPDTAADPGQYHRGGDPQITSIQVIGGFQTQLGQAAWDEATAPMMTRSPHPKGRTYALTTPPLPAGFYEYKYLVTFADGSGRRVADPCSRYGGSARQSSGIAVGGTSPPKPRPVAGGRRHLRDLVIYELMIDDFTDEYRGERAPIDAVRDKLDYLRTTLGVNAILFMPWTAWPGERFNWGYDPHQYFSVEYRYANALGKPAEKLSWLIRLVDECHALGLHVIMDGVFNHVGDAHVDASGEAYGFPYKSLYLDAKDCPYVGDFGGTFGGLQDLDFNNPCTQEFIRDICLYWIDELGLDGIRFDNTVNYFLEGRGEGLPKLLDDIRAHCAAGGIDNFSLTLEHLIGEDGAASVTNRHGATSCWYNALYGEAFDHLWNGRLTSRLMRALNAQVGFDPDKVATTYIGNHDHAHVAWQAGARTNRGGLNWYRTQPWAIALLTCPGAPMLQNGQEFAEDHWLMENDEGSSRRVKPRPLRWDFERDNIGSKLLAVYRKLIALRLRHACFRSANIYPLQAEWETRFNAEGYGVDTERGLVIFHRWGTDAQGALERAIVVLNFTGAAQAVDVPFPANGSWLDALNGDARVDVSDFVLRARMVPSNWGSVFLRRD